MSSESSMLDITCIYNTFATDFLGSLLAICHSMNQNTKQIMFQSVFEEVKSCLVNIETIYSSV